MRIVPSRTAQMVIGVVLCTTLLSLHGCRTAPITQRRQLLLIPEGQELALGRAAYFQMLEDEPVSSNSRHNQIVERIGHRIAAAANRPDYEWEFRVLASPEPNAFCLPGGKVGVYEGMIELCQNEAELAVVISHEVAHALQRHGGERMSQGYVVNGVENAMRYLTQDSDAVTRDRVLSAYGVASEYGVVLPFSRKHELEADHVGLILMAQAGYDPTVAPGFWERFAQVGGPKPPEFFSTHPADLRRAQELRARLYEAQDLYAQASPQHGVGDGL
jgi:metalloendopeptidase OMA1, mitochondrial